MFGHFQRALLKLPTVHIPISKVAWLKVAFESHVKSLSVNMLTVLYWCFGHLRPWVVCLLWQDNPHVILCHNRGGWSHVIISRDVMIFDCNVFSYFENLFKQPFQVDDWINQLRLDPDFILGNFHVEQFL